ncbi:general substrate transporter [Lipomyces kononenkoae]|uniref:General substrate transporter n=1 Tax=Lipomyces kononenkoae TaxID=34357 RepID=A0ACC3SZA0_LIPKO
MVRILNIYTISAFVALAGVIYGFDVSSMSGVIGTHEYKDYFGNPLGTRQGAITGAIAAGSLVGALSSSFLGEWLSRKVAIQVGSILWCIGAGVQASSTSVGMLIGGRIISGLCIGITSSLVPIYQSEIAPRKIRGRVVSLLHFAISWGILIQYLIEYGCSFLNSQAVFRLPWAIQAIPAIFLFLGLFFLPRSPRWLASKDKWDEVLQVLAYLRTPNSDINDPLVLAEYKEIEEQIGLEREQDTNSYRELFRKKMRRRLFLGMAVQGLSQLTGINIVLYFVVYILQSAGTSNTLLVSAILYIIFIVATIPTILWTDRWGRRSSLLVGSVVIAFWMFVMGSVLGRYGQKTQAQNLPYTWVILGNSAATRCVQASAYLASAAFAMTWGPIEWVYPPEIVPMRVRTKAVSFSTATNWATSFTVSLVMPLLYRVIAWRLFIIYGAINLASFFYVLFFIPETKQRTLEEMDEIFEHGEPIWRSFKGIHYTARIDQLAKEIEQGKSIHRIVHVELRDDIERHSHNGFGYS